MIAWLIDWIIRWLEARRSNDIARQNERELGAAQEREIASTQTSKIAADISQAVNDAPKTREGTVSSLRRGEF